MSMIDNAQRKRKSKSERSHNSSHHHHSSNGGSTSAVSRPHRKRTYLSADDIGPIDTSERNALEQAVLEMKTCKDIFTNWEFEVKAICTGNSDLEKRVLSTLDSLSNDAEAALSSTENIVKAHMGFGSVMAQCFLMAASDPHGALRFQPELSELLRHICEKSVDLTEQVSIMQDDLEILVSVIEEVEKKKSDKTLWEKISAWVKQMVNAVAGILTAASVLLDPGRGVLMSRIAQALVAFAQSQSQSTLDPLRFLSVTLPAEAADVAKRLRNFKVLLRAASIEKEQEMGRVFKITKEEAMKASVAWQIRNADMHLIPVRK